MSKDIESLVAELRPAKKVISISRRFLIWLGLSLLWTILLIFVLGVRSDLSIVSNNWFFYLESLTPFVISLVSSVYALRLSVPGVGRKISSNYVLMSVILWAGIYLSYQYFAEGQLKEGDPLGFSCLKDSILIGSLPLFALLILIRKGAVVFLTTSGLMAFISAFSMGIFALQFTCENIATFHFIFWHIIPIYIFSLIGSFWGDKIFRW